MASDRAAVPLAQFRPAAGPVQPPRRVLLQPGRPPPALVGRVGTLPNPDWSERVSNWPVPELGRVPQSSEHSAPRELQPSVVPRPVAPPVSDCLPPGKLPARSQGALPPLEAPRSKQPAGRLLPEQDAVTAGRRRPPRRAAPDKSLRREDVPWTFSNDSLHAHAPASGPAFVFTDRPKFKHHGHCHSPHSLSWVRLRRLRSPSVPGYLNSDPVCGCLRRPESSGRRKAKSLLRCSARFEEAMPRIGPDWGWNHPARRGQGGLRTREAIHGATAPLFSPACSRR